MTDDDDHELARRAGSVLTEDGAMVAVAESSTGGLVGSKFTDVPGASSFFERSIVTYSNDAKLDLLNVDLGTLEKTGAVSAEIARQMASGVRENAGTKWGVSTTGIAGPSGGTPEKPVGTVFIGTACLEDGEEIVSATRYEFDGDRLENKNQFARQALQDLIEAVESRE
ncbi:nicotinamide-nucleotide amidohydrolase family protein [Halovenus sp. WSH3]|uniref:Nicotinamide-nucleotide amidohydrolase family protein n=1 Tax=Halovenus carboxidivorans TaxID=2692199 RepID=A0A6B0SZS5_9EURY|nr:CinA family protein [Halovenus carboxidivorans]MXR51204.1 nicotinamide-nucleotide amidohydrolase family protein [Halovenus carboxidivorans]